MKTNFFADMAIDELVFENRNKAYGAYDLRKTYEDRLTLSAMATVSFFMLFFAAVYYLQPKPDGFIISCPTGPTIEVDPVTPPIVLSDLPRLFPKLATSGTVVPVVVKTKVPTELLPEETKNNNFGKGDEKGTETGNSVLPVTDGTATGKTIIIPEPEPALTEYIDFADKAPEFLGGQAAYEKYLQSHLKYPPMAIENNIQGTIFLMLKINAKGKITAVEVIKGIGGGCDQEAARVLKSMPDWKPGIQNGKEVAVKCVVRVKMLLQN